MGRTWNEAAGPANGFGGLQSFQPGQAFAAWLPLVEGVADFNGKVLTSWIELNREWMGFIMGRVQQDVGLVHHLCECKTPQEIYAAYTEFYRKTYSDYQGEAHSLAKLGTERLGKATHELQENVGSIGRAARAAA